MLKNSAERIASAAKGILLEPKRFERTVYKQLPLSAVVSDLVDPGKALVLLHPTDFAHIKQKLEKENVILLKLLDLKLKKSSMLTSLSAMSIVMGNWEIALKLATTYNMIRKAGMEETKNHVLNKFHLAEKYASGEDYSLVTVKKSRIQLHELEGYFIKKLAVRGIVPEKILKKECGHKEKGDDEPGEKMDGDEPGEKGDGDDGVFESPISGDIGDPFLG